MIGKHLIIALRGTEFPMKEVTQKFHKGDLVRVAKDLGPTMGHFTADIDAIVIGSYKDQYGGSDTKSYSLHLKGQGHCSWYWESQLELLEANRGDLLAKWEADAAAELEDTERSGLDLRARSGGG